MEVLNFDNFNIRTTEDDGETLYSIIDVIGAVSEASNPNRYWSDLKSKLIDEGYQPYENIVRLKLIAADGKMRQTDCANRETILRLIQSVPSPNAEPFKQWLANAGNQYIEETEDPSVLADRYKDALRQKGYDENWILTRIRSVEIRTQLTEEWQNRDVKDEEFALLTNDIMKGTFGLSTKEYKALKGLVRQNLRDNMSTMELVYTIMAEETTRLLAIKDDAQGFRENRNAARQASNIANDSMKRFEQKTGLKVVTSNNALNKGK